MNPPNSPCECGSGKKQKKCHYFGAPEHGCETEAQYMRRVYLESPEGQAEEKRKSMEARLFLASALAISCNHMVKM